jgi:anti-sigma regulatory factor (Ser/Thr protein kinase)
MSDEIRLVVPATEDFRHVAHLVLGGLGARLDLPFEELDDLQTALDALLACRDDDGEIEVTVGIADDSIRSSVGPFGEEQVDDLDSESSEFGLRRVLETVADAFEIERRDGKAWVVVTKRLAASAEAVG